MITAETFAAVRENVGDSAALVPTMGFLHEGHLALVEAARTRAEQVVMSLFVNPLQFDDPVDLERYPRRPERDTALAGAAGVDVLFMPPLSEMYPTEPATTVRVASVAASMEGAERPGHFDGVATVVTKLFAGLRPALACFGRKDGQQLAVVTTLAADLSFPVEVVGVPTVRESDGLALSSRNVRIPSRDRPMAATLSRGLFAAADAVEAGERSGAALEAIVAGLMRTSGVEPEYVVLADAATAAPLRHLDRPAFLATAARVGDVRLIDNIHLPGDGSVDRGIHLDEPSVLYRGG